MPKCECCGKEFEEDELQDYTLNYGDDVGLLTEKWCAECVNAYNQGDRYEI